MARSISDQISPKYLTTTIWALLFPLVVGCSVQPTTKHLTDGEKSPAVQPQEQAVTTRELSGPSGSMSLLMPSGMPAQIDQVRLSLARLTPEIESLYTQKLDIDARLSAAEKKLKQLELTQGNNISNMICWNPVGGVCGVNPFAPAPGLPVSSGIISAARDEIKVLRDRATAIDTDLDAKVTAAAKSDPRGQQLFQLGVGMPQLQRFDLVPGHYYLLVEVLDSTTGKVYQKGRGSVEIVAGQVAEANIKLVPVSQPEGGLIVTLGGSGFTKSGESKVCPTPTPATVCPLKHVILTESDALWQHACQAQGHQLISCVRNKCDSPIPSEGTQLCSGVVK